MGVDTLEEKLAAITAKGCSGWLEDAKYRIENERWLNVPPKNYLEKKMLSDEIVDEVRAIRDAHAAKFGYDLQAIYADLKKSEAEHIAAGHPFISTPERPVPSTALQRSRFAQR